MNYDGTILVAGATGGTGFQTVKRLAHYGVRSRAMVRSVGKGLEFLRSATDSEKNDARKMGVSPNTFELAKMAAELTVADVRRPETLAEAMRDVRAVICATGIRANSGENTSKAVDFEGTVNLVNAAKAAGVEHFVLVTTIAVNQPFNPVTIMFNLMGGLMTNKNNAEKYLRASGLRHTIVRPGGLNDAPGGVRGLKIAREDALFIGYTSRADVAETCIQALVSPNAFNCVAEVVNDESAPVSDWNAWFGRVR
jgi:uncharacterized protein YbjT (DUF2867 family)